MQNNRPRLIVRSLVRSLEYDINSQRDSFNLSNPTTTTTITSIIELQVGFGTTVHYSSFEVSVSKLDELRTIAGPIQLNLRLLSDTNTVLYTVITKPYEMRRGLLDVTKLQDTPRLTPLSNPSVSVNHCPFWLNCSPVSHLYLDLVSYPPVECETPIRCNALPYRIRVSMLQFVRQLAKVRDDSVTCFDSTYLLHESLD